MITLPISIRAHGTRHNGTLALKACASWCRSDGTFGDPEDRTLSIADFGLAELPIAYNLRLDL